jgi:glucokinase
MQNENNLLRLNQTVPDPYQRRVVLGLGTGLGMKDGMLLPDGNFWLGKNEIGHIGIINPPLAGKVRNEQHVQFMRYLYQTVNREITLENILTGRGLSHLHQFLYPHSGNVTPEQAGLRMAGGKAPELLDLMAFYLGFFTGSVQLIFLPEGGVWITGGVAIKHLALFSHDAFYEGMNASPAFAKERAQYSLGVMKNEEHALIGAAFYAAKKLLATSLYPC